MRLSLKLGGIFLIFAVFISLLFYFIGVYGQDRTLRQISTEHVKAAGTAFRSLKERDAKMLSASLDVIVQDPGIKARYLKKDRQLLYSHLQPLFERLRGNYGITHFYFILPDGHVFLRMHEKDNHGDLVKRASFEAARKTGMTSTEMELGKTAFALRTVTPYYDGDDLIGYVELGEEIDHFLHMLKGETHNEFVIMGDKKYLDRVDWKALTDKVRSGRRMPAWDSMQDHLLLGSTGGEDPAKQCYTEEKVDELERGASIISQIKIGGHIYSCGGFTLNDAAGNHVGAIMSLIDVTDHVATTNRANRLIRWMSFSLFLITFVLAIVISRSISTPILKLANLANAVGRGDLDQRVDINSRDEIGQLGRAFNGMIEMRRKAEDALAASERKYRSLMESTDDYVYLVDKSYNYLYMNKNYAARMGLSGDEYLGRSYLDIHMPTEIEWFVKKVDEVFLTGRSVQREYKSKRDGRYYLQTLSPVEGPGGGIEAVTIISKDVTNLKAMEETLHSLSITDELTGLFNRRGFFGESERLFKLASRKKAGVCLLYIDMDGLKHINDTLGHKVGDLALTEMANVLKNCFRDSDIIARIGGDEFVVFPVETTCATTDLITGRLNESLRKYNEASAHDFKLSASVGIAYYDPELPLSLDELLMQADKQMYEQKNSKGRS